MKTDLQELYQGAQTLFRAFSYLEPRMKSPGSRAQPLNAETLAGCVLHACMATLVGEIRQHRTGSCMGLTV
jgi:hypothetical protein